MTSTSLVEDAVSTDSVDNSFPGTHSQAITVKPQLAPMATLALLVPSRGKSDFEVAASIAHSNLRADDGLQSWKVGGLTVGNVAFTFGYRSTSALTLRAGVGMTKLFAAETGLFRAGNSIKPMAEAGANYRFAAGGRPLHLDARVETHRFGTTTMRQNSGLDGNVWRVLVQFGTTIQQRGAR